MGIKIKKLVAKGNDKQSDIDFAENVTIITGPSNTGKTYVFKCLDYMLGAKKDNIPFANEFGYNTLILIIESDGVEYAIERKIGTSNVDVIDGSGNKKTLNEKEYCDFLLSLVGIEKDVYIPKKEDGTTQRLTFRTLFDQFKVKEEDIETEKSVLLLTSGPTPTPNLAALLYAIYNTDFQIYASKEKKEEAAKNAAIEVFLSAKLKEISNTEECDAEYSTDMLLALDEKVAVISKELKEIDSLLDEEIKKRKRNSDELIKIQDLLVSNKSALSQFEALATQYAADIERLSLVVDGKKVLEENISPESVCPFCGGPTHGDTVFDEIKGAQGELNKTIENLVALENVIKELKQEIILLESNKNEVEQEKKRINDEIQTNLLIRKDRLSLESLKLNKIIESHYKFQRKKELEKEIEQIRNNKIKIPKFDPKEIFPIDFYNSLTLKCAEMLEFCGFSKKEEVIFDKKTFDLICRGKPKKENGKGYRAFLNSTLLLSFFQYVQENAKHPLGFLIIDTPLHGLSLPDEEQVEITIKKKFYQFILNGSLNGQIIIMENPEDKNISISKESNKVSIIKFSGDENFGRYGFLI